MTIIPNFLIIGAARCATTTLYQWLKNHPQVYLPRTSRPEPHFFFKDSEYVKNKQYYIDTYFFEYKDEIAVGEKSTSYLFGEPCPERIYDFNPSMKLICSFREPMERSLSNYLVTHKNGFEELDFITAVNLEDERTSISQGNRTSNEIYPHSYIGRSRYGTQVKRYLKYFQKDSILFLTYEEIENEPELVYTKIINFLELPFFQLERDLICKTNSSNQDLAPLLAKYFPLVNKNILKNLLEEISLLEELSNKDLKKWKEKYRFYL